ncbi:MAG TPA: radical SAM protein, partial [Thermodesulfovibrionales bacterium]|nr:radical SAM protein [Thermodesulfovibrionales bacterium]
MLRNRASKLKLYVKRVLHRKGVYSSGSVISREDNISLYRSSRAARRAECPNLPLNLLVEVTSRCNLECRMCNVHHNTRSGRMIPDGLLDATLDLAKTASVVYPFGLGEPLLHPDIVGIVRRYKSLGAFVGFVTNGMLLTEKISGGLIANGLDHLTISVDAADKALLSQIRRGAD